MTHHAQSSFILFLIMYVCACAPECECLWMPEGSIEFPGTEVTGSIVWVPGTVPGLCVRGIYVFNHYINHLSNPSTLFSGTVYFTEPEVQFS